MVCAETPMSAPRSVALSPRRCLKDINPLALNRTRGAASGSTFSAWVPLATLWSRETVFSSSANRFLRATFSLRDLAAAFFKLSVSLRISFLATRVISSFRAEAKFCTGKFLSDWLVYVCSVINHSSQEYRLGCPEPQADRHLAAKYPAV